MTNIYAALEIGTTRTVLAVGEAETGGRLKVTCHAEIPSSGVRKSQIININNTTQSIRSVIHKVEEKQEKEGASLTLGNVVLAVSGQHIRADVYTGMVQVEGKSVSADDIAAVEESARQFVQSKDRDLLGVFDQDYELDGLGGIASPQGMTGRILKLNTLQVHADHNRIEDARSAANNLHLEIRDAVYAVTCAADAVLEEREKRDGVLVLDFGGGSTGYAVYLDGSLAATGVIGVGGDHISNDISFAFQTTQAQAEELKIQEASAMLSAEDEVSSRVKLPGESPIMESRTISRRALNTVVNARMHELMEIIRAQLAEQGLEGCLHAGVVMTGGGAALKDLDALVQHELGASVRVGRPIHVDGFEDEAHPEAFATIAGTLLFAHQNYEEKSLLGSLFGGLFK
jgi:cell division protein FtsA